ncbi:helix-turn-helix domain-containing protein [Thiofilum flexile]|uniref:helix-turn-helix domain-containing protein n=1 Tax=Thiofilum flexile TaxID=125627 RepID=UPI00037321CD|nr:XRE family transcriptional regulator [Thiofilum flexile]
MRTGVTGFKGQRLVQARTARGLTQTALSAISGCSKASISKWERNEQLPEAPALEKIASSLGLPPEWFLSSFPNYGESSYFFRSSTALTKDARNIAKVRLEWAYELSTILQEWVDWPAVNIPTCLTRDQALTIVDSEIEQLAQDTRKYWGLGLNPIENIIKVVESAGILVVRECIGHSKMDGVSRWFDLENRPYIFIAADKANAVRSRFDIAHELAHIIMHRNLKSSDTTKLYNELERQAHLFASAFLMPAENISLELSHPTLDTLIILKRRWKTSVASLIMRAKSLNLLSEEYLSRLWKNYSARGWKTKEPLDDDLTPEQPLLLNRAIKLLLEDGGFNKKQILKTLTLNATDVESLCNLPDGFFDTEYGEIIQLPILKNKIKQEISENTEANILAWPNR